MATPINISQLIAKLEEIKAKHGDSLVMSVNYHLDFDNVFLTEEELPDQVEVCQHSRLSKQYEIAPDFLLIYGGGS